MMIRIEAARACLSMDDEIIEMVLEDFGCYTQDRDRIVRVRRNYGIAGAVVGGVRHQCSDIRKYPVVDLYGFVVGIEVIDGLVAEVWSEHKCVAGHLVRRREV